LLAISASTIAMPPVIGRADVLPAMHVLASGLIQVALLLIPKRRQQKAGKVVVASARRGVGRS
jgi:hypothetical protein